MDDIDELKAEIDERDKALKQALDIIREKELALEEERLNRESLVNREIKSRQQRVQELEQSNAEPPSLVGLRRRELSPKEKQKLVGIYGYSEYSKIPW